MDSVEIPYNQSAEEAVLGSILLNPEMFHPVRLILPDGGEEFYIHRNRFVWQALETLVNAGTPVDMITLSAGVQAAGKLEEVGGEAYAAALLTSTGSSLNAEAYAAIVHKAHLRRRMLATAGSIANMAYKDDLTEEELIAQATSAVNDVAKITAQPTMVSMSDAVREVDAMIEENSRSGVSPGIPTGLIDLDRLLGGGAQNLDLNLIATRPGWGKTSLLLQMLTHAAWHTVGMKSVRKRAIMFSLEMPRKQLVMRMLATLSGIEYQTLRTGNITQLKFADYYAALEMLSGLDIVIDDTPAITPAQIRSKLEVVNAERPVDIIFLDSLNLMSSGLAFRRSDQETDYNAIQLKNIARWLNVPFWAAHQMNRSIEYRGKDSKPTLSDLREGGEQPADGVFFIYHETSDDEKQFLSSSIICAKQRNGPKDEIPVVFRGNATKFESAASVRL